MKAFTTDQKRARAAGVTTIGIIGTDALNEYAEHIGAGRILLSRRPCSPTFWFYGLALDAKVWSWGPKLRALLSPGATKLLELVDLSEYTQWCTCCDEALGHSRFREPELVPTIPHVQCWPCLFDCHDLCSHECSSSGEIHFPERVMETRRAAA